MLLICVLPAQARRAVYSSSFAVDTVITLRVLHVVDLFDFMKVRFLYATMCLQHASCHH